MFPRESSGQVRVRRLHGKKGAPLAIGLLNLMPDSAFAATEQQFRQLLAEATGQQHIQLDLLTLPAVARSGDVRAYVREHYRDFAEFSDTPLDGLIVTGTEPLQSDLRLEPYWHGLTQVVDWAAENTNSTLFSCLAAHAAVLHLDGIQRQPMKAKLTGVFACPKALQHWTTELLPETLVTPHSRWNGVMEADLLKYRYNVLSRSPEVGVDLFAKNVGSEFIFLQGHPEYAADTLLKEYRRDVRRYLTAERDIYPGLPANVFDSEIAVELENLARQAMRSRDVGLLGSISQVALRQPLVASWQNQSNQFYRNWLQFLAARADVSTVAMEVPLPV